MTTLALSDTDTLAKVTRARDRALALYPWFGALAMGLRIKADTRIPTMATDGTSLFFNPMGCAALSEPNLMFVWAHEVMHCGLLHMYRKPSYLDWHEWNVCTDLAINGELVRLQVGTRPESILLDPQYDGLSAEQIAHARRKARQQAQQEQADRDAAQAQADATDDDSDTGSNEDDTQDDAGDDAADSDSDQDAGQDAPNAASDANEQAGDGADEAADQDAPNDDGTDTEASGDGSEDADGQPGAGAGDAGEPEQDAAGADAPVDAFDPDGSWQPGDDCLPPSAGQADQDADGQGQTPEPPVRTEADWQLAVDQTTMAMRKAGEMPGSLVTMVNATRKTRTDWREVTRAFIEQVSPSDYTWRRANKRFASQGLYLPGIDRANLPPMMVIVDSSGSCGQAELDVFASALTDILVECKPRAIYVVCCDTRVNGEMTTFTPEADSEVTLTAKGSGGTYFQPAFDWVAGAMQDGTITDPPACILYLTDGYAADLDRLTEPEIPVLFAIVPGGTTAMPFGEVIEIELE